MTSRTVGTVLPLAAFALLAAGSANCLTGADAGRRPAYRWRGRGGGGGYWKRSVRGAYRRPAEPAAESTKSLELDKETAADSADEGLAGKGKPAVMRPPSGAAGQPATTPATTRPGSPAAVPVTRMIIYYATLRIEVADKDRAMDKAQKLAESLGGHLQSRDPYRVVLRIPAKKFSEAMTLLGEFGEVYHKAMNTRDVTEQYLDLRIRLSTALSVLKRLRELLLRTKNVKEALEVEREIARLVEKIERLKGKIRFLENLASLSTVTVYFTTPAGRRRLVLPPHRRSPFRWVRKLGIRHMLRFR